MPGGDVLRWDRGSLLVLLALACLSGEGLEGTILSPAVEAISWQHLHLQWCVDACASSSLQAVGGRFENDHFHVIINLSCSTASALLSPTLTSFLLPLVA